MASRSSRAVIGVMLIALAGCNQADPELVASLAAQVVQLRVEVLHLEARLDALPECFQLREGGW